MDAERVLHQLNQVGVSTAQISIVPNNSETLEYQGDFSGTEISDGVEDNSPVAGTIVGILLGAIAGSLTGLGLLMAPEVGLVLAIGGSGTVLLSALAGAGCGIATSGVIQACSCKKHPEDPPEHSFEPYPSHEYLVMVEGTDNEVHYAQSILRASLNS